MCLAREKNANNLQANHIETQKSKNTYPEVREKCINIVFYLGSLYTLIITINVVHFWKSQLTWGIQIGNGIL